MAPPGLWKCGSGVWTLLRMANGAAVLLSCGTGRRSLLCLLQVGWTYVKVQPAAA